MELYLMGLADLIEDDDNELLKNIPWYIRFILFAKEGSGRVI